MAKHVRTQYDPPRQAEPLIESADAPSSFQEPTLSEGVADQITPVSIGLLTITESVYCQLPDDDTPAQFSIGFSRPVTELDQPYSRNLKIGEQWTPVDTGWLETPCMILLTNKEGRAPHVEPTDAQRQMIAKKILEIATVSGDQKEPTQADWLVIPGESVRLVPADVSRVRIRCRSGECRITATSFPG